MAAVFVCDSSVKAQPAQWTYSLPNNIGTATYPGNVVILGTCTGCGGAGSGVTSVGLAAPGIFSVSGSPVTTTGTLTLGLATETANVVWAGPTTGSAATPTFRSLVAADIPSLSYAPLASPSFTGTPLAPTPSTADNTTKIATTAYVQAQGYITSSAVSSVFGRSGAVVAATNDYAFSQISGSLAGSQLPSFSGDCTNSSAALTCTKTSGTAFGYFATGTAASNLTGTLAAAQMPALTGDITTSAGAIATTLATVNSNVGTFQGITVNGKGLVTAASNQGYLTSATAASTYLPLAGGTLSGTLNQNAAGFALSGTVVAAQFTGTGSSPYEFDLQNTSANAAASTDFIVNNDQATNTTHYGDFGINSSGFTGTGSLNIAGATYLYAANGDLVLGTSTANDVHIVVNGGATDALDIANATGAATFSGPITTASLNVTSTTIPVLGVYTSGSNTGALSTQSTKRFSWTSTLFGANSTSGGGIENTTSSATVPTILPLSGTTTAGLGGAASAPALIVGSLSILTAAATAVTVTVPIVRKGYTVGTLPTGVTGAFAYVTDAVTCTFLATLTGGGSAFCPVGYNGTAWVAE